MCNCMGMSYCIIPVVLLSLLHRYLIKNSGVLKIFPQSIWYWSINGPNPDGESFVVLYAHK